jgi:hypothetical protein
MDEARLIMRNQGNLSKRLPPSMYSKTTVAYNRLPNGPHDWRILTEVGVMICGDFIGIPNSFYGAFCGKSADQFPYALDGR